MQYNSYVNMDTIGIKHQSDKKKVYIQFILIKQLVHVHTDHDRIILLSVQVNSG